MTLQEALKEGVARLRGLATARRDAEMLLLHAAGRDRAFLLSHPDQVLSPRRMHRYREWVDRRAVQEPIQYIVGEQEFFGLSFRVTRAVLIPRPETEHLVEALLERVDREAVVQIADVGTGSGAVAVAGARALPKTEWTALDISPAALAVARRNARRHGVRERIRFRRADLLVGLQAASFDAVASNPPYVAEDEILEPQVRDYEPRSALYAGPTGLEVFERLIPQARTVLKPGGWLLLEIGYGQQPALSELLAHWEQVRFLEDLRGIPRVAVARRGSRA